MAAHHPHQFAETIAHTITVDGDCDTNAAIVGGVVALSAGPKSIPPEWLSAREPLILHNLPVPVTHRHRAAI
jgi:ADP-ribosylglycohydrolase